MRAAVPGKGGRGGDRQACAGRGTPDLPGPAFCSPFWGRAIPCAAPDEEEAAWVRAGPGGTAGRSPGETSARASAAGTRSQAGIRPSACPREVFSSGGLRLVSVSRLPGADGRIRTRRGEPSAGPPPLASRARTRGRALGTRAQVGPLCPAPSPAVLSVSPLLLPG